MAGTERAEGWGQKEGGEREEVGLQPRPPAGRVSQEPGLLNPLLPRTSSSGRGMSAGLHQCQRSVSKAEVSHSPWQLNLRALRGRGLSGELEGSGQI